MEATGIDRDRLERLRDAAMEAATARIEKDGHFQPLLFELRANGSIHHVAVLDTISSIGRDKVIDRLVELMRERARQGTVLAAAIAIHLADESAIEIRLRAPNHASNCVVTLDVRSSGYLRKRRHVSVIGASANSVENDVF